MKCLYCGKRLALFRKFTDNEFCSDGHRRLYQQEQGRTALSRLVDAQKRFSGFIGLTEDAPRPIRNAGAHEQAPPPLAEDQMKGFLEQMPRERNVRSFRRNDPDLSFTPPDPFQPEHVTRLEAHPVQAGSGPLPELAARPAPAAPRSVGPHAEPRSGPVLPPTLHLNAPRPQSTGSLAEFGPRATNRREAAPAVPSAAVWEDATPLAAVRPASAAPLLPRMAAADGPMPAAPEPCPPGGCLPASLAESTAFPAPDAGAALHRALAPIAPPANREAVAALAAAPPEFDLSQQDPPFAGQLRYWPPAAGERPGRLRKVRTREIFFSLPRLGDLPQLADRLARAHQRELAPANTSGAWTPGVVASFQADPVYGTQRPGVSSFGVIAGAAATPGALPYGSCQLGEPVLPQQMTPVAATGPMEQKAAPAVPPVPAAALELFSEPCLPATAAVAARAALAPGCLAGSPGKLAVASGVSRMPVAVDPQPTIGPNPGYWLRTAATAPALRIPASNALSPIVAPPARAAGLAKRADSDIGDVHPFPVAGVTPRPSMVPECGPPEPTRLWLLTLGEPISYPAGAVATQALASLWPDPVRLNPRLQVSVAEDSEMREAIRAMRNLHAQSGRSWIPKIGLPTVSFHFSRPDLKWFAMSVPVVLLVAVYSFTGEGKGKHTAMLRRDITVEPPAIAAPAAAEAVTPGKAVIRHTRSSAPAATAEALKEAGDGGWMDRFQEGISRRAAISLGDDFRSGLGDWEGRGDWSRQWSYDSSGFVRTGPLALYKPSLSLTDYRMEFLGQIEKKSMGWVYRAQDAENYYASKITLVRGGPLPVAVIERFAVVNGKESRRERLPLPLQIQADTLYRVRVDVRDNGFTLTVQGQVVDHWSDDRLQSGGVGFFSGKGELARLRWVEISHQYDFLGRLCAMLAPYNLPAKDGSLKQ